MEFKVNLSQIIATLVQLVALVLVVWRISKHLTTMDNKIDNNSERLNEHIERTDKAFDKIDRIFDKWEDRFFGKSTARR